MYRTMINAEKLLKELEFNMDPFEFEYVESVVKQMQTAPKERKPDPSKKCCRTCSHWDQSDGKDKKHHRCDLKKERNYIRHWDDGTTSTLKTCVYTYLGNSCKKWEASDDFQAKA